MTKRDDKARFHRREIMKPTNTAFEKSPVRGQGLARDMGVRWALEEVAQPYDVRVAQHDGTTDR